ncbi:MAG: YqgE/AlgH family protein [Bacteroidota bacterium]
MVQNEVGVGKLLLAEPFMLDPNFKRSVVLLCEHGGEGTIGFIMNKPLNMKIDQLLEDFPEDFEAEVFFGGPVQTDTIHYLHCCGPLLDDSTEVSGGIYWGGDFEKLKFLIRSKLIHPRDIRFFVGYSGWSEGQLSDEMGYGSWVLADMDANYLFKSKPAQLWEQVMYNKGNTYTIISKLPEYFSWN